MRQDNLCDRDWLNFLRRVAEENFGSERTRASSKTLERTAQALSKLSRLKFSLVDPPGFFLDPPTPDSNLDG